MNAYRQTVLVFSFHYVFGSPDLFPLCLSDLQMYTVIRLLALQAVNITLNYCEEAVYRFIEGRFIGELA